MADINYEGNSMCKLRVNKLESKKITLLNVMYDVVCEFVNMGCVFVSFYFLPCVLHKTLMTIAMKRNPYLYFVYQYHSISRLGGKFLSFTPIMINQSGICSYILLTTDPENTDARMYTLKYWDMP